MLCLALGILRCPTRWQRSFCATATPSINISPSARFATVGASCSRSYVELWGSFTFSCFLCHFCRAPEGFFFVWTMTGSPHLLIKMTYWRNNGEWNRIETLANQIESTLASPESPSTINQSFVELLIVFFVFIKHLSVLLGIYWICRKGSRGND